MYKRHLVIVHFFNFIEMKKTCGLTYQSNLKKLIIIILQKQVISITARSAFDAHTEPLFKKLGILNVDNIYKLQVGKFMYLYKAGLLADSLNMFSLMNQVHSYETRSLGLFYLPYCRTNRRKFSICFQGPKFFNSLSPEIQNSASIVSFTLKPKEFLLT